ncbi:unnamed protein product [Ostreobium quekettii]|uniref:mitogen-activated protein kinase kinase kinase n=1 Tax=Ostreobium quekettii TaxID=121088 RepID=A0A8S1J8J9_9CHLO|nr:unnamed protein product [Ostreobium quekettii]|eukprot:evm.model.scf_2272.3 EVM.evm.TU.scf_2272.3   scf_2272:11606-20493(+)
MPESPPSPSPIPGLLKGPAPSGKLPSRSSTPQSVLADRYVLGSELGKGAHGHVYKALDKKSGSFVAVKQISLAGVPKDNLSSVMAEIDLLKDLNHRNIVKYFDSIKTRNHLYIVLEYMENGSLANVIKPSNFGAFPEHLVSVYIAQVLEGLKYLHEQGVVHRDIKGANILTTKEGLVKLADFGVAAKLTEKGNELVDHYDAVAGSPYWMAPEIIEMTSVGPAADVWSLGCLVVELLTGYPPYFDCQPIQALYKIVQDDCPPFPEHISPLLDDFLIQCFHKEPAKRATAAILLEHGWIQHHNRTLKATWNRSKSLRSHKASNDDTRASVSVVVERILQHQNEMQDQYLDPEQTPSPEATQSPVPVLRTGQAADNAVRDSATTISARQAEGDEEEEEGEDEEGYYSTERYQLDPQDGHLDANEPGCSETDGNSGMQRQGSAGRLASTSGLQLLGGGSSRQIPLATCLLGQHSRGDDFGSQHHDNVLSAGTVVSAANLQWPNGRVQMYTQPSIASVSASGLVDATLDVDTGRQEAVEMRRLVTGLRPYLAPTQVAAETANLVQLLNSNPGKKPVFLTEGGPVVIVELLNTKDLKVLEVALELVNVLCTGDPRTLESLCVVGLAPIVFRYASASYPARIRHQAARFVHLMCHSSIHTVELFVACQGIPTLACLFEEGVQDNMHLVETGLACVWRLIDVHGPPATKNLCRLFATTDLPHKLAMALVSMVNDLKNLDELRGQEQQSGGAGAAAKLRIPLNGSHDGVWSKEPSVSGTPKSNHSVSVGSVASYPASTARSRPPASPSQREDPGQLCQQLRALAEHASELLLLLSDCDTAVRSHLCEKDTLGPLLRELRHWPTIILFKIAKCLKHLSSEPELLGQMQDAGTLEVLVHMLSQERSVKNMELKKEVLSTIYNMCKINRSRQEQVVAAGVIPHLCRFSSEPRRHDNEQELKLRQALRPTAVSLLCRFAHSSPYTRQEIWSNDGLTLMLRLLVEEQWQPLILDALATWLEEDIHRVEPKLMYQESIERLVTLLQSYRQKQSAVAGVLDPLLRMLQRSDKLSRQLGQGGLVPVIMEMLRTADAATSLKLLKALRSIYEMHPRPKEFIKRYDVERHLHRLASGSASGSLSGEVRVLVRKAAQELLRAFQMNQIW